MITLLYGRTNTPKGGKPDAVPSGLMGDQARQ